MGTNRPFTAFFADHYSATFSTIERARKAITKRGNGSGSIYRNTSTGVGSGWYNQAAKDRDLIEHIDAGDSTVFYDGVLV